MLDFLKSLLSPKEIVIILVSLLVSGWFKSQTYSLKEEKSILMQELEQADKIITSQQTIIEAAAMLDTLANHKIDSIQTIRHETDTTTILLSDIDSLRAIWAEQFNSH